MSKARSRRAVALKNMAVTSKQPNLVIPAFPTMCTKICPRGKAKTKNASLFGSVRDKRNSYIDSEI